MLGHRMEQAINEQIMHEIGSAYLYLSMAADFDAKGLQGMAQWMKAQAQEELGHALRFFHHISKRGGRAELFAIDKPQKEWESPLVAFRAALQHEQFITGKIHDLVKTAREENDIAAEIMLQWFVTEQVEEEDSASSVVCRLERIGDSGHGLLMADRDLGQRAAGSAVVGHEGEAK